MNKKVLDMFDYYKIVTYIPKNYENEIIGQMQNHIVNKIGEYINCMSWVDVCSTWTPTSNAEPLIGKPGERSIEPEVRLEFQCKRENVAEIVNYINEIHPYEKAEIDIIPFFSQDEFLVDQN